MTAYILLGPGNTLLGTQDFPRGTAPPESSQGTWHAVGGADTGLPPEPTVVPPPSGGASTPTNTPSPAPSGSGGSAPIGATTSAPTVMDSAPSPAPGPTVAALGAVALTPDSNSNQPDGPPIAGGAAAPAPVPPAPTPAPQAAPEHNLIAATGLTNDPILNFAAVGPSGAELLRGAEWGSGPIAWSDWAGQFHGEALPPMTFADGSDGDFYSDWSWFGWDPLEKSSDWLLS